MAAGKLYVLNASSTRNLPATWESNVDAVQGANLTVPLEAIKDGNGNLSLSVSEAVATNPYRLGWVRGVTRKLAAQTISGTLDVVLGVHESNADAEMFWKIYAYVTEGETDNIRGVLLDYEEDAGTGTEFPTTSTGTALNAPAALTPVDAEAGDYLVIEFAFISRNSHTTSRNAQLKTGAMTAIFGNTQMSDLTVGSTSTTTLAGYVEFSAAVVLLAEQANDDCANAIGMTLPYSLTLDPTRATREFSGGVGTEPAVGCSGRRYHSLWWKWTPASSGNYHVVGTAGASDFYSFVVSVWIGSCGSFSAVTCDAGSGVGPSPADLTFAATGGTEYYVLFTSTFWGGAGQGMSEFTLDVTLAGTPPANATCATAETIAAMPFVDVVDTSDDVSNDAADPDPGGDQVYNTIWYVWVAPADMYVRARTEGSDHACRVAVFTGACGGTTLVRASTSNADYVLWLAESGVTYRLMAGALAAVGGGFLTLTVEALPNPQSVEPGREFVFGFHRRGSQVFLPDASSIVLAVFHPGFGDALVADAIAYLQFWGGSGASGGVWNVVDWNADVHAGPDILSDIPVSVNAPYVDEWLGRPTTDDLQDNISRAETLVYHSWAIAVRTSAYDPNLDTFDDDGYVALNLDGVTVGSAGDLTIPHRLQDGVVRLGFRAEIDVDAVWLGSGLAFPAVYAADGRPELATLIGYWGFANGLRTGWDIWPLTPFTPGVYVTPTAGKAGYGVSSWSIAADAIGPTSAFIHGGLIQPYGTSLVDSEGVIGPIAWVEWPRRVPS